MILHNVKDILKCYKAWGYVLCLLSCYACTNRVVHHQYQGLPNEGWTHKTPVNFQMQSLDSNTVYDLTVEARCLCDYPYQNLGVRVNIIDGNDSIILSDTLSIVITDSTGTWNNQGLGRLHTATSQPVTFQTNMSGKHHINLQQLMDTYLLSGVKEIGIKVKASR